METAQAQESADAPSQQPPQEEVDEGEDKADAEVAMEDAMADKKSTGLTFILTEDEDVQATGQDSQPLLATVCSESADDMAAESVEPVAPPAPAPSRSGPSASGSRIEAHAKPQPQPGGASLIWFSGSLWKLATGDREHAELMSWRRRYFMISWAEPVGLVMSYVSEKENCKRHLGCIVRRKGINSSAAITRMPPIDVTIPDEERLGLIDSCKQYDLAVHRTKFDKEAFDRMGLPTVLHRIAIDGMDHKGKPRRLVVALDNAQTMLGWLLMLECVAEHHLEEALL